MLGVKSCHRIKNITKIKDIGGVYSTVKFKTHSTQKPYSKRRCYQHLSTRCQAEKDCSLETLLDSVLGSRLHMMPVGMLGVKSSVEIVLGAGEGGTFLMSLREALQSARHKAVFEAACSRFLARSTDEKLRGEVVRMLDSVSMDSITHHQHRGGNWNHFHHYHNVFATIISARRSCISIRRHPG